MHISLLERRSEIGVRRALGHQRWVVGAQFVVESGITGVLGGVAGLLGGTAFAAVVAERRGWELIIDTRIASVAVLAAVAVSAEAGLQIARRAANLDPIEALRST